jgi:3-hydroxyisobutyrate dehydrogenase-like beta-hydroxyacid dehydrogenase
MKVGFIGLGLMGSGISANLQKAGHAMVVHDARRAAADRIVAAGAEWAASPKAVAEASEIVFTSLPGPPEFEAVAAGQNGLLSGVQRGQPVFDFSTNSPTLIRRLAPLFAERGAHLFDSPVSGGPAGAASGKMAIWVGGDEAVFQRYRPVLDGAGDQILHIGPIGSASVAKLVHNLAGYVINTALAEAFTMGVKAGVEPLTLWKAIRQGANGRRRTFDTLGEHFLPGHYDPARFALKLAHKDVSLATQVGKEVGVPMRLSNLTLEEMTEALARGWEKRDSRSSMILQQERAGLAFSIDREEIAAILRDNANR